METDANFEAETPRPGGPKIRDLLAKIERIPTVPRSSAEIIDDYEDIFSDPSLDENCRKDLFKYFFDEFLAIKRVQADQDKISGTSHHPAIRKAFIDLNLHNMLLAYPEKSQQSDE